MKKLFEDPETVEPVVEPVVVPTPAKKDDNTILWLLALALIGLIVLFYFKNRNDGTKA